jgi:hypothetical protein
MKITCHNPSCGKTLNVLDTAAGKTGKRSACRTTIQVPNAFTVHTGMTKF